VFQIDIGPFELDLACEFRNLKAKNMLTLGHIIYSNCFPPHAGIVTHNVPFPFKLVEGIPTELNRMLFEGKVDVSPSSSIEYAMHPGRYLLLPSLSITSKNRVMSILLESRVPIAELDKKNVVALTTASATSVILLRILLERRHGVFPGYLTYEQGSEDPSDRSDAMLTIGDLALLKPLSPAFPYRYDLGEQWHEFTGLPFVFAFWHVNYNKNIEQELRELYDILKTSKSYGLSHLQELACAYAGKFGIAADVLLTYWNSLSYDFADDEQRGLMAFYGYAAEIGAVKPVTALRFWTKS
jgi:chorismate dehydratase